MGLPVGSIDKDFDFTIHNLKYLHPDLPFTSIRYRPNYFSFLFLKDGKGEYTTDDKTFPTRPGTIYFTNPGHYKSFKWYEINEVYLVTFTEVFLKTYIRKSIFKEFPFLLSETVHPKTLSDDDFSEFERLYLALLTEYKKNSDYKAKILGSLLLALLLKIKSKFWDGYDPIYDGNRSSQIVKNFKKNLEHHYRKLVQGDTNTMLQVRDYAEIQNLSSSYFSTVIKNKTGKSVKKWIIEKTV